MTSKSHQHLTNADHGINKDHETQGVGLQIPTSGQAPAAAQNRLMGRVIDAGPFMDKRLKPTTTISSQQSCRGVIDSDRKRDGISRSSSLCAGRSPWLVASMAAASQGALEAPQSQVTYDCMGHKSRCDHKVPIGWGPTRVRLADSLQKEACNANRTLACRTRHSTRSAGQL